MVTNFCFSWKPMLGMFRGFFAFNSSILCKNEMFFPFFRPNLFLKNSKIFVPGLLVRIEARATVPTTSSKWAPPSPCRPRHWTSSPSHIWAGHISVTVRPRRPPAGQPRGPRSSSCASSALGSSPSRTTRGLTQMSGRTPATSAARLSAARCQFY
jgi:hypothetical protein